MDILRHITRLRLHHVLFWIAFFVVWITLRIDDYPDLTPTVLAGLLKVLSLAGAVYFTNYVLIPGYCIRNIISPLSSALPHWWARPDTW